MKTGGFALAREAQTSEPFTCTAFLGVSWTKFCIHYLYYVFMRRRLSPNGKCFRLHKTWVGKTVKALTMHVIFLVAACLAMG